MRGNATTSLNAERQRQVRRMSCNGGAMRGKATTSRRIERRQHIEPMSGAVQQEVTRQPARVNKRQMGVGGGGGALRGSNAPRGQAAEAGRHEALLQPASTLRGGLHVKRMGGKGGATRSNTTTSQGKQKANGRWEVEVVR
jgi:hypothetical protein